MNAQFDNDNKAPLQILSYANYQSDVITCDASAVNNANSFFSIIDHITILITIIIIIDISNIHNNGNINNHINNNTNNLLLS